MREKEITELTERLAAIEASAARAREKLSEKEEILVKKKREKQREHDKLNEIETSLKNISKDILMKEQKYTNRNNQLK